MKKHVACYLGFTSILIASFLFPICENSNLVLNINNGEFNISYNSSSCNLLNSSVVSNNIKCLILCQMTVCKSLLYDGTTNRCILNGSQPELIKYDNLTNLNIAYNLGIFGLIIINLFYLIKVKNLVINIFNKDTYLSVGQSCLFGFTCNGSFCSNGTCVCMRNLTA